MSLNLLTIQVFKFNLNNCQRIYGKWNVKKRIITNALNNNNNKVFATLSTCAGRYEEQQQTLDNRTLKTCISFIHKISGQHETTSDTKSFQLQNPFTFVDTIHRLIPLTILFLFPHYRVEGDARTQELNNAKKRKTTKWNQKKKKDKLKTQYRLPLHMKDRERTYYTSFVSNVGVFGKQKRAILEIYSPQTHRMANIKKRQTFQNSVK